MALELGSVYGQTPWAQEPRTLEELLARPPWMADAGCAEHPEVRIVSGRGESTEPLEAVCRRCLVLDECLAYAMADETLQGVWRGTSTRERDAYRKGVARRTKSPWSSSPTPEEWARRALQRGRSLRAGRA